MDESNFQSNEENSPVLSVIIGLDMGTIFPIRKAVTTIGRGEDRDIQLNDRAVSRMHCEIKCEDDRFIILDSGSQNGIKVNGRDTKKHELKDGDQIDIGSTRFMFTNPNKEEEIV